MIISLLEYTYKSKKQIVRQKVKLVKDVLSLTNFYLASVHLELLLCPVFGHV